MAQLMAVLGLLVAVAGMASDASEEAAGRPGLDPWELPPGADELSFVQRSESTASGMKERTKVGLAVGIIVLVQLIVGLTTYFSSKERKPQKDSPSGATSLGSLMKALDADRDGLITQDELAAAVGQGLFKNIEVQAPTQGETVMLRVIKCNHRTRYVKTLASLAAKVWGEGSRMEALTFNLGAKHKLLTTAVWSLWWLGCTISLLTLANFLQHSCIWASVLMLPLPALTLPVLCADLVKSILGAFEFYFLTASSVWIFCCALIIQEVDLSWLFWVCALPTLLLAPLMDAYPAKFRTFFAKHFFLGVIIITVVWNILILDGRTLNVRERDISAGSYSSSFVSHTVTASIGLLGFCLNYIYVMFVVPDQFVLLKAPLLTLHEQFNVKSEQDTEGGQRQVFERFKTKVRIPVNPLLGA